MCLAVPGKITEITGGDDDLLRQAKVSFAGIMRDVSLAYVPEAQVGDYVMVHVGLALSVVDEHEAAETLCYLEQIAELKAQERTGDSRP
jgi:hydrogenase expression/formation protein HypC